MDLPFHGLYINLDRAVERRTAMAAELERLDLAQAYQRFPAIDGQAIPRKGKLTRGETAIFRSHVEATKRAAGSQRFLHILEDDAVLSDHAAPVVNYAMSRRLFDNFDLIFLDVGVYADLASIKSLESISRQAFAKVAEGTIAPSDFRLVDLRKVKFFATSSYLVNPRSAGRLIAAYEKEWASETILPLDNFMMREIGAGTIKAACILPMVTTVRADVASQSGRDDKAATGAAFGLLRQSFFVDRDLAALAGSIDRFLSETLPGKTTPQQDTLARLVAYFLSDNY
jgi:GR25 family glycosyltransferase involved in LPS biosynthesis